ncbi:uncharacterized protein TRAVEDRAFT_45917 [Trametes versicolor FP-101664 SS1]|uniref:uncharacterized protein n=1 Tax=Trametes versicolor (strain FP-101664) TaxID=717944 RepID=UPI0004622744|nr:uncharacterized protein TRAVEDRAFT_45917 [Trametes versicolor FP-101664 SS1]EIW60673.1 hypothetical protein TRAVEDRAFT_45917 [Trametes versicolor FP-101664 SS1]
MSPKAVLQEPRPLAPHAPRRTSVALAGSALDFGTGSHVNNDNTRGPETMARRGH